MVITRENKEEIVQAVNEAIKNALKSKSLIDEIIKNVTEAVVKSIETKFSNIESTVAEMEKNYKMVKENYDKDIKLLKEDWYKLEEKLDQMDQANRSNNLRIFNLKEESKENTREIIKKYSKIKWV